jgi:Glycosyl hydrolases family 15
MSYSTRSLYLSNWRDLIGIWMNTKLAQTDRTIRGPRLGGLHYLQGPTTARAVSQIVDYTGFFRDEDAGAKYTQVEHFDCEAWLGNGADDAGTLTTNYLGFDGAAVQPRLRITRRYAAVPNERFFVVRYELTNPGDVSITFNLLDQVHLANLGAGDPARAVHAWYDARRNALIADMSASGQFFVALGAFEPVDGYQVGDDDERNPGVPTASGWSTFDNDGTLHNNGELRAANVALAFQRRLTVAPGRTETASFYLSIRADRAAIEAAVDGARAQPASFWLASTARAHRAWLANDGRGATVHFSDGDINDAFERALIVIKNAQNPVLGTFVATTNPFAYGYKNWVRDASITSIALDASGHTAEAEQYWRWMAGVQGNDGTWKTTYQMWDGGYVGFVEPEYDSVGTFIYGVYRHFLLTADSLFLRDLWPAVQRAADWILQNIQSNGLGAADFSIWEEAERGLEHNSYTQAWYVAGLYAAQSLAELRGDTAVSDWYAGGPAAILTALQRPSNWWPPGMWNVAGYYNRAVNADNSVQPLEDTSSNILMALGLIDPESERARSHMARLTHSLAHDEYGLSRYHGDDYYFTNPYSPAGDEVLAIDPAWPQMSMWAAIYELRQGNREMTLARLKWCVSTMARGYMPQGEAVSNVTRESVASSMCEPLTASAFLLATLAHEGRYELQIFPPVYNAGTYKTISMNAIASGDWAPWSDVPYFLAAPAAGAAAIRRVYLANDADHLYIRIDLAAAFDGTARPLSLRLYARDLAGADGGLSSLGLAQTPLPRPMSHLVEHAVDAEAFIGWRVVRGQWTNGGRIDGTSAWRWDPARGGIAAAIPFAALASGAPPDPRNAWTHLQLIIAERDRAGGSWIEGGAIVIHYRMSQADQPWTYGNIER